MKILLVARTLQDAQTLREALKGTDITVGFMFQMTTGNVYDVVVAASPQTVEEQRYVDEILRTHVNPGGHIVFI